MGTRAHGHGRHRRLDAPLPLHRPPLLGRRGPTRDRRDATSTPVRTSAGSASSGRDLRRLGDPQLEGADARLLPDDGRWPRTRSGAGRAATCPRRRSSRSTAPRSSTASRAGRHGSSGRTSCRSFTFDLRWGARAGCPGLRDDLNAAGRRRRALPRLLLDDAAPRVLRRRRRRALRERPDELRSRPAPERAQSAPGRRRRVRLRPGGTQATYSSRADLSWSDRLTEWMDLPRAASVTGLAVVRPGVPLHGAPGMSLSRFSNMWSTVGLDGPPSPRLVASRAILVAAERARLGLIRRRDASWTFGEVWYAAASPEAYPSLADVGFIGSARSSTSAWSH